QWARLPQKDIALAAVAWKYGVRRSTVKRFSVAGLFAAYLAESASTARTLRESLQGRPTGQLSPDEKKFRRWLTAVRKRVGRPAGRLSAASSSPLFAAPYAYFPHTRAQPS